MAEKKMWYSDLQKLITPEKLKLPSYLYRLEFRYKDGSIKGAWALPRSQVPQVTRDIITASSGRLRIKDMRKQINGMVAPIVKWEDTLQDLFPEYEQQYQNIDTSEWVHPSNWKDTRALSFEDGHNYTFGKLCNEIFEKYKIPIKQKNEAERPNLRIIPVSAALVADLEIAKSIYAPYEGHDHSREAIALMNSQPHLMDTRTRLGKLRDASGLVLSVEKQLRRLYQLLAELQRSALDVMCTCQQFRSNKHLGQWNEGTLTDIPFSDMKLSDILIEYPDFERITMLAESLVLPQKQSMNGNSEVMSVRLDVLMQQLKGLVGTFSQIKSMHEMCTSMIGPGSIQDIEYIVAVKMFADIFDRHSGWWCQNFSKAAHNKARADFVQAALKNAKVLNTRTKSFVTKRSTIEKYLEDIAVPEWIKLDIGRNMRK